MPHTVTLSDETFKKLQSLAVPLVDTTESVIRRLVDEATARAAPATAVAHSARQPAPASRRLKALSPESLKWAQPTRIWVNDLAVTPTNWAELLRQLHILARHRLTTFEAVRHASRSNIAEGRRTDRGYVYIPEASLSIQGVDADEAWQESLHLARRLNVALVVEFVWQNRSDAAHPGEIGWLEWRPGA